MKAAARFAGGLDAEFDRIELGWRAITEPFRRSEAGRRLIEFVDARVAAGAIVYPPEPLRALALTPRDAVRAVIVGQDPYHGPDQAEGLAFSVAPGQKLPPSLRNIVKELRRDLGVEAPASGSLMAWARRGVLLLNSVLTVEDGQPASHAGRGWEALTDAIVSAAWNAPEATAFLLWGASAQLKIAKLGEPGGAHRVWRCNHPSPLAATRGPSPFVGCGHFAEAARFLDAAGRPLDWRLQVPLQGEPESGMA